MNIRRIVPDISASNLEKTKEFYGGFLGLKLVMDLHWVLTFASETNPTAQINILQKGKSAVSNDNVFISVEVSEIDKTYEEAVARKYEIVYPISNEPWGVRRFFVKDPNGVTVNIMCHI